MPIIATSDMICFSFLSLLIKIVVKLGALKTKSVSLTHSRLYNHRLQFSPSLDSLYCLSVSLYLKYIDHQHASSV